MGSAFTVPCVDNNNEVTLVGTHLENELVASIKKNKNFHPSLKTNLSPKLNIERFENLKCRKFARELYLTSHFPTELPIFWKT